MMGVVAMNIEIENINIVIYSIIIAIIILFVRKKPSKFKKGVIVANTTYLKRIKYYKQLLLKYRICNFIIIVSLFLVIIMSSALVSNIKVVKDESYVNSHKEKTTNNIMIYIEDDYDYYAGKDFYDYDIDDNRINKLKRIVDGLKNENIGIIYRNNARICLNGISSLDMCKEELNYKYNSTKSFFDYQNLPIVLSSFSNNYTYTKYVLDSLLAINNDNLGERLNLVWTSSGVEQFNRDHDALANEKFKVFNYITAHFIDWGNINNFSGAFPGLASGNGIYFGH